MARVTVAFKGVVDGKIYPQDFVPGDLVYGSLAEEVVKAGWANEDENAPIEAPSQKPAQVPTQQTGDEDPANTPIEIPVDWQNLSWPALRKLAAQVAPGSTGTKDEAIAGIQGYIDANSPAVVVDENPAAPAAPESTIEPSTGGEPAAIDGGSPAAPTDGQPTP